MDDSTSVTPSVAPQSGTPAAAPEPASDVIDINYFMKVQLRVGQVVAAEAVEKSKKLLKLQVDLGPLGKRQILSGIAKYYTPEQMVGKKIVVVANLKPAMMMGLESQGMRLAASTADGATLTIVTPSAEIPLGSEVR